MSIDRFLLIAYLLYFLSGLGLLITLIRIRHRSMEVRLLGIYLGASLLSFFVGRILYSFAISPNYAGTAYRLAAFLVITLIYHYAFNRRYRKILLGVALCFVIFGIINVLLIQRGDINSYTDIFLSLFTMTYAVYYFFMLMKEMPTFELHKLPMFWINSAFILYFAGNLFLFVFTDYLVEVLNNNLMLYWTFHNVLSVIEILLLIVAAIVDLMNRYKLEGTRRSAL
jgi:hypothetical protein